MLWGMGILSLAGVAPLMIANAPRYTIGVSRRIGSVASSGHAHGRTRRAGL